MTWSRVGWEESVMLRMTRSTLNWEYTVLFRMTWWVLAVEDIVLFRMTPTSEGFEESVLFRMTWPLTSEKLDRTTIGIWYRRERLHFTSIDVERRRFVSFGSSLCFHIRPDLTLLGKKVPFSAGLPPRQFEPPGLKVWKLELLLRAANPCGCFDTLWADVTFSSNEALRVHYLSRNLGFGSSFWI